MQAETSVRTGIVPLDTREGKINEIHQHDKYGDPEQSDSGPPSKENQGGADIASCEQE
jgi:hypothetical protein